MERKRVRVGILSDYRQEAHGETNRVTFRYVTAIEKAGWVAYIVPCNAEAVSTYVEDLDGFVFPGGADIDPALYGAELCGAVEFVPKHDGFLFRFMKAVIAARKPVLWICKGMQLINVYFGGSLIQNLSNSGLHFRPDERHEKIHEVSVCGDGGFLSVAFDESRIPVNSIHHQAIDVLGEDLKVVARSVDDGTVEAIEHRDLPVFGVQWHPECLESHAPIFRAFVGKCGT